VKTLRQRAEQQLANRLHRLRPAEAAVLAFLQQRLAGEEHRLEQQLKASLKRRARRSRRQAVAA
jgi:hypothetical protein